MKSLALPRSQRRASCRTTRASIGPRSTSAPRRTRSVNAPESCPSRSWRYSPRTRTSATGASCQSPTAMRSGAGGDTCARDSPGNASVTSAATAAATCLTPPTLTRDARQSHTNWSGFAGPAAAVRVLRARVAGLGSRGAAARVVAGAAVAVAAVGVLTARVAVLSARGAAARAVARAAAAAAAVGVLAAARAVLPARGAAARAVARAAAAVAAVRVLPAPVAVLRALVGADAAFGSHTSEPQHAELSVHASPVPRHPHVLLLGSQTLGEQQSLSLLHDSPDPRQPHVEVFGSQSRAPQQSPLPVQPSPLEAQPHVSFTQSCEQQSDADPHGSPSDVHPPPPPPPSPPDEGWTHVLLPESQTSEPQQSVELFAGLQSPPCPAHAGWQVPDAQLSEQQSPFVLQQSSSSWQSGSVGVQAVVPPSPVPESMEPPLPLPASLLPPLPLPLPLPEPASLPPLPLPLPLPLPVPPSLPRCCCRRWPRTCRRCTRANSSRRTRSTRCRSRCTSPCRTCCSCSRSCSSRCWSCTRCRPACTSGPPRHTRRSCTCCCSSRCRTCRPRRCSRTRTNRRCPRRSPCCSRSCWPSSSRRCRARGLGAGAAGARPAAAVARALARLARRHARRGGAAARGARRAAAVARERASLARGATGLLRAHARGARLAAAIGVGGARRRHPRGTCRPGRGLASGGAVARAGVGGETGLRPAARATLRDGGTEADRHHDHHDRPGPAPRNYASHHGAPSGHQSSASGQAAREQGPWPRGGGAAVAEWESLEKLLDKQKSVGGPNSREWLSQYQQRPSGAQGVLFQVGKLVLQDAEPPGAQGAGLGPGGDRSRLGGRHRRAEEGQRGPGLDGGTAARPHHDGPIRILDVVRVRGGPEVVGRTIVAGPGSFQINSDIPATLAVLNARSLMKRVCQSR